MLRCGLDDLEKSTIQQIRLRLICIRMMARRVVAWIETPNVCLLLFHQAVGMLDDALKASCWERDPFRALLC